MGGNPRAYKENIRFSEANLNRSFGTDEYVSDDVNNTYERKRALMMQEILDKGSAVLDIHQQQTFYKKKKVKDFIVCDPGSRSIAKKFNSEWIIHSADEGSTDRYMDQRGKIGICYEAGSVKEEDQEFNIKNAFNESRRFLQLTGNIIKPQKIEQINIPRILKTEFIYRVKENFVLDPLIEGFDILKAGQLIGKDGDIEVICSSEQGGMRILFPGSNNRIGREAFSLGRELIE